MKITPTVGASAVDFALELEADQESRLLAIADRLLPYQTASVRRMVRAVHTFGGALDASDTGTGKTFVALAACAVLGRRPFVVCPKPVIPVWLRTAEHFGTTLAGVENYELLRRGRHPGLTILDHGKRGTFDWRLDRRTVIIFDECHRCKDRTTLNTAMALAALRQGYRVMGLSATAADNPLQMKFSGLLTRLFPAEKSYFSWLFSNGVRRGRFGLEFKGGRRCLAALHRQIFPAHGSRLRIVDLGDQFPETQITAEAYAVNGATEPVQRAYDEMADTVAKISAGEEENKQAAILVAMLRARQQAELLKIPALAEMASDAVEQGMSVAVFVNFDDSMEALLARLKTRCCVRGGQAERERQSCLDRFQADLEPVIVCNLQAGSVGVNLHGSPTARRRLSIICPTWSGQDLKQALGRVWRAGGAKSIQRIFFAAGTIEEQICRQVQAKLGRIEALNDGDLVVNPLTLNPQKPCNPNNNNLQLPLWNTCPTARLIGLN